MLQIHQSNPFDPNKPMHKLKKRNRDDKDKSDDLLSNLYDESVLTKQYGKLKVVLRNIKDELRTIQMNLQFLYQLNQQIAKCVDLLKNMFSIALQSTNMIYKNQERLQLQQSFESLFQELTTSYNPISMEFVLQSKDEPLGSIQLKNISEMVHIIDPSKGLSVLTSDDAQFTATEIRRFTEHMLDEQIKINHFEKIQKHELDELLIKLEEIRRKFFMESYPSTLDIVEEIKSMINKTNHEFFINHQIPRETAMNLLYT